MISSFTGARARVLRALPLFAFCLILAHCGDDGPTAPNSTVVPTPLPVPNVAGSWTGSYRECSVAAIGCSGSVAATATFSQNASGVTGTVTTQGSRFHEAAFQGSLSGNELAGTLTIEGERKRVTGSATANTVSFSFNASAISSGTIELHR